MGILPPATDRDDSVAVHNDLMRLGRRYALFYILFVISWIGVSGLILPVSNDQNRDLVLRDGAFILVNAIWVVALVYRHRQIFSRLKRNLTRAEQRYRTLAEQLPAVTYVARLGADRPTVFTSPRAAEVLPLPEDGLAPGRPLLGPYIHPEDRERVSASLAQAMERNERFELEYRCRPENGNDLWLRDTAVVVPDESGSPVAFHGLLIDISDRKKSEEALRSSEERYRQMFDNSPTPMWVVDTAGGDFLAVNDRAIEHYLYTRRDFLAMRLDDLRHPRTYRNDPAAAHAGPERIEHHLTRLGRVIEVAVTTHAIDFNGRDAEIMLVNDVTEQRQRERELETVSTVTGALRSAPDRNAIYSVVLDCCQDLVQAEGAALFGCDKLPRSFHAILGNGPWSDLTGRSIEEGQEILERVFRSRSPYLNHDIASALSPNCLKALKLLNSVAIVPLIAQEETIGALAIGRRTSISEREMSILLTIADIAASAIHRATLHEQTRRHLQKLWVLRNIDLAITGSRHLQGTLDTLLDQITGLLGVDASAILLYDDSEDILEYGAGRGFRTDAITRTRMKSNEGCSGWVVSEKRLVTIQKLNHCEMKCLRENLIEHEGFVTYCGLPLIADQTLKGVLEVYHRSEMVPDDEWFEFLESISIQAAIAIDNVLLFEDLQKSNRELLQTYDLTIEGWSRALELRDHETEGHSMRVTEQTVQLAREMGMGEKALTHVRRGALLHDIGKMGIPDHILRKPGPLTADEQKIMRTHPTLAHHMLSPVTYLQPALNIPLYHHERWDGTGYPHQLSEEGIPLEARVFSVIDVWDALTSDRPYRPAWPKEKTRRYLHDQAGQQFDPEVVETFLDSSLRGRGAN